MRRIFALALCLFCFLCFGGASVTAETEATAYAFVNNPDPADRLNLRTEPRQNADSLGKYYNGVCVQILEEDANSDWVRVRIGSNGVLEGYMMKKYLEMNASSSVPSAQPFIEIRNDNGTGLNLRSEPDLSADSFGLYRNGTKVTVMGLSDTWCHVCVDGKTGFMLLSGFDGQIAYNYTIENRKSAVVLYNTSMYSSTDFVYENQITTLPPGNKVDVLETNAKWTKVRNGIRTGYVQTSALSFE